MSPHSPLALSTIPFRSSAVMAVLLLLLLLLLGYYNDADAFAFTHSIYASRRECFNLFLKPSKGTRWRLQFKKEDSAADAAASTIRSSHGKRSSQPNKASAKNQPERRGAFLGRGNPHVAQIGNYPPLNLGRICSRRYSKTLKYHREVQADTINIVNIAPSSRQTRCSRQLPA